MPENENASAGKALAEAGLSANGFHAQSHSITLLAPGSQAIWRNADHDLPVIVTGLLGERDGVRFYSIEGSTTGIPEHELHAAPDLLATLGALLAEAHVDAPQAPAAAPMTKEIAEFLLSAGQSDEGNAQWGFSICKNHVWKK